MKKLMMSVLFVGLCLIFPLTLRGYGIARVPGPLKACSMYVGVEQGQGQWGDSSTGWKFYAMMPFGNLTTNCWRTGVDVNDTPYSVVIPMDINGKTVQSITVRLYLSANGASPSDPAIISLHRVFGSGLVQLVASTTADNVGWQYATLYLTDYQAGSGHYFLRVLAAKDDYEYTVSVFAGTAYAYYDCE